MAGPICQKVGQSPLCVNEILGDSVAQYSSRVSLSDQTITVESEVLRSTIIDQ